MADLDITAAELMAALDRLEKLARPLAELRAQAQRDAAEIQSLRQEREQLRSRIAGLEEEARTLSGVTNEVEGRLDDAIAEIRAALAR